MQVTINGNIDEVPSGASVRDVLTARNLPQNAVIVELNGEIIRKEDWDMVLSSDDSIEIVRIVGGG
jgi:thiamine biosynthesis protein ThiS